MKPETNIPIVPLIFKNDDLTGQINNTIDEIYSKLALATVILDEVQSSTIKPGERLSEVNHRFNQILGRLIILRDSIDF